MAYTTPRSWTPGEKLTAALLDEQVRDNIAHLKTHLELEEAALLTISSGVITVTQSYHEVAGEGAADDDLDTISGGSEGEVIHIRASGNSITLKNGTGNLNIGVDIILTTAGEHISLIYDGANWSRTSPGGTIDMTAPSDLSSTNVLGTVYHNGTKPRQVLVTADLQLDSSLGKVSGLAYVALYVATDESMTVLIPFGEFDLIQDLAECVNAGDYSEQIVTLSAIIPPNYYYRVSYGVSDTNAHVSLIGWIETDLG